MNVLISGSSGLIGGTLARRWVARGDVVRRLVRGSSGPPDVRWDPSGGEIDRTGLEGAEVVVHLAGEPLANGRWTPAKKSRIVSSRVEGTRVLAESLAAMAERPRVLLSASAIGYYGSRGDELLTEASTPGTGFLAEVCRRWEEATLTAEAAGIRVVHLRIGVVLDPSGGALKTMLPAFRMGMGGRLGNGSQWLSWIALEDVVGAIELAIERDEIRGPLNIVAPEPVTNSEFTSTLARAIHRPAFLPVPAPLLRLAIGGMADEAVLASARVRPERLLATGYRFARPRLEDALAHLLGNPRPDRDAAT